MESGKPLGPVLAVNSVKTASASIAKAVVAGTMEAKANHPSIRLETVEALLALEAFLC